MDSILKNKITTILQSSKTLEIINTSDFYFLKARDVLQDFLQLEVSDEVKTFLLSNRKEYNELKQLFEDSQDLAVFGKLIFSVITYCDSNAHKKIELNEYENKRVLALAFVRMNNWVEQLITYKFERQLPEGSVKNAVDYLLNPTDNFTMLSENHRSQISENLFLKKYTKETFKNDFLDFFSMLDIKVLNAENLTHLLSRIAYSIINYWRESLIGIISPDSTGWQENHINLKDDINYLTVWNHRKPNMPAKTLKLLRGCIEEHGCFRIFYSYNYKVHYVAEVIDFVVNQNELDKSDWGKNYENINWDGDKFENYKDESKSASIIYLTNRFYKVAPILESNFKYYANKQYPTVGSQAPVISFISNIDFKNQSTMQEHKNLLEYKKQIILQGPPGTGKTRLAKEIAVTMLELEDVQDLNDNAQFKLIQFHPSYTYEDFVRGIVAKPNENGEGIVYEVENKTLGAFAKEALKNYKASIDTSAESDIEIWIDSTFEDFKNEIEKDIEEKEIELSGDITLFKVQSDSFRYGKNWDNPSRINFSDFKYLIKDIIEKRFALSNQQITKEFSVHAHYRYTYYNALLKIFFEKYEYKGESYSESKKNYILIIDEINRANLSSVLGELIYALEYRGEAVESVYEVIDDNTFVLPPNLYIIGTMNTADRSVGHIDYAIRRRFAFVDVLPKDLSEDETIVFDSELFKSINVLFTTDNYITRSSYLSTDFEPKDVALGHSYFIDKTNEGGSIPIRWKYEIKPILLEYIKDGILKEPARAKITEIDESFLNA